ncbi:cyclic-di-AMP receptor [Weissella ceti]|uniref:Cyclic-di-AMP receptor n=1 Tax=Weissella ceti TaxID=759620 RepID=A0ABT3E4K1_9LACO|nr:cyclic-di-AMP receptor [Weissella ceti]MCW0953336.1 cyclic-di-AMP receptor [Weissella ceti]QVK11941.1 cyclic-di-AMP receptor [Weissella ceti]
MKMITAIVQDQDANVLTKALVAAGFQATRLASTGSFLRAGNTTFIMGVQDEQLDDALALISENAKTRSQVMTPAMNPGTVMESVVTEPLNVQIGGATVFVQNVEQFHHF